MEKIKYRERPPIITSSLDTMRIYNLLDDLPADSFVGREELLNELARGNMVGPKDIPPNIVTMNCILQVLVSSPVQQRLELTLVYPEHADEDGKKVSIFSPLGSALIGLRAGDEIEWPQADGGLLVVKVEAILYQPEREGHYQI